MASDLILSGMPISELLPYFVRQEDFPKCSTFIAQQGKFCKGNLPIGLSYHLNIVFCTHAFASDMSFAHRLDLNAIILAFHASQGWFRGKTVVPGIRSYYATRTSIRPRARHECRGREGFLPRSAADVNL
jgi:hypothetical protein